MSDKLFETIGKVSQAKGFKRKRGKKALITDLTPVMKKKEITSLERLKTKIGAEGLLPVQKITDGSIWSDTQVQKEIQRALLPDVTTKVVKSDIAPKFLQTELVTAEHVKRWIPRGIRSIRGKNPGYRMSDRLYADGVDKIWAKPEAFFLLASNTIDQTKFMREDPKMQKEGFDVAMQIFENLLQYGRRTMPELMEDLGALQPELISMVANGMINDHYLKIMNEIETDPITNKPIIKEGKHVMLETMELVEQKERLERIKKYSRSLEDIKRALGNGKRSNEKTKRNKRQNTRRLDNKLIRVHTKTRRKKQSNTGPKRPKRLIVTTKV